MPSSRVETQVTWAAAAFLSVAAGATSTSDAMAFNVEDWAADLQLSADNDGAAAAGDLMEFRIAYSSGDILGDTGDDFDTTEHAQPLVVLDTLPANTPGEDPARVTVPIRTNAKAFRVIAVNKSAGRAITVRARLIAHRPQ